MVRLDLIGSALEFGPSLASALELVFAAGVEAELAGREQWGRMWAASYGQARRAANHPCEPRNSPMARAFRTALEREETPSLL